MAKKYTKEEWDRIQSRLPEEDRIPYSESPEAAPRTYEDADLQRNPKTGLSPAQEEANKLVREAADLNLRSVVPGAEGLTDRVLTPYEKGSKVYNGKEYATAAGAYSAAVKDAEKAGPPGDAPAGLHWNLQGTEWKLYDAEGKPFNYIGSNTADFSGEGTANSPLSYKGKPFTGVRNGVTYVNGFPKGVSSAGNTGGNNVVVDGRGNSSSGGGNVVSGNTASGATSYTASDGKTFTDRDTYLAYQATLDSKKAERKSAYDLLYQEFAQYGLQSLVEPLKGLIQEGISPSEFTLRLRESEPYKKRFAANAQRVAKGLRALSEAEYINLEDAYQNVMRNYGLPESYYTKGDLGIQQGFEKFIAGDVSAPELEDRIQTAQNRVINAAPEVSRALKQFYPDITNGDILAYALDPQQALANIKRKVGAAEIGAAAMQQGLGTNLARAEELQKYGVTQQQAQQGYQTIGGGLQRGSELASLYAQSPYTQTTAEQEVFGLPSATEASKKRKQLIGLERATFGGQTGAGGALQRERSGQY